MNCAFKMMAVVYIFFLSGCETPGERAFINEKYDAVTINLGNIVIGRDGRFHSDPIAL